MNDRSKILNRRNGTGSSASTILRRRTRKPIGEGGVVELDEEDFVTKRLRGNHKTNSFRYGEFIHVSDIIGKCPRMIALSYRTDHKIVGDSIYDSSQFTFAIGRALQDYVTDKLAQYEGRELFGNWECLCGRQKYTGTGYDAKGKGECTKCGSRMTKYQEMTLVSREYGISGSIDLTFLVGDAFYLTEVKSIGREDWNDMKRPLPEHILQVVIYWWLATVNKWRVYNQVSVIYLPKTHVFKTPYKEFAIKPREHLDRIQEYLDDARLIKGVREEKESKAVLPHRECRDIQSPQAKKCELAAICFNMRDV